MPTSPGPLDDLLIVDLSRVLAGPYATMVLGDLGARIVKVERPPSAGNPGGDDSRHIGPFKAGDPGQSAYFASINRGKESIALDLADPADRAVFDALVARADVLVENFRPGVMARLGLGWDALHARHPRRRSAAASGFGHTGPDRGKPAYDMIVQAMGGIMSVTGWPGGPPTRVGTSIGDITAGLFTVAGILAALHHRHRTGEGLLVDVAMLDGQIAILENAIARYAVTGVAPGPLGARHPSITPFAAFACGGGHIVVAAGNNGLFKALAVALDLGGLLDDPRFATNASRTDHAEALAAILEARLGGSDAAHWLAVIEAAGVPCGPLHDVAQALSHRQVVARNMAITTGFPDGSPLLAAGNPIKLSGYADPAVRAKAPALDEHRAMILEDLGL
jgi:CoA:oxalate CoA-transferase